MERIAAILAIFVLLMNGRHVEYKRPAVAVPITIMAERIPIDRSDSRTHMVGELRYLEGWELRSDHPAFGGFSSMHFRPDGQLVMLSDTGEVVTFHPGTGNLPGVFRPLPFFGWERYEPNWRWDSESHAVDEKTGQIWVGIELTRRICRYSRDFAKVERCRAHPAIQNWPQTTGMESLIRLPDGRFLAIAEDAPGPFGGNDVLLFAGDPVSRVGEKPKHLGYLPPEGYVPTDAVWLGHGRMLVMNRRVTPIDLFTGVLTLVEVGEPHSGQMLKGRVVARLEAPIQHDNYEALALTEEKGEPVLWVASDDNHLLIQRTLLLKFALPRTWVDAPPPGGGKD
ncbi:MAG TPA: esterase-like activity of phytase family protein [Sphingobium sp.]|uniref:esterase-like activity of phytase family protein n=1 Tax=Sphingobium sp. TaxID=1912891 RepID=UPI002ED12877